MSELPPYARNAQTSRDAAVSMKEAAQSYEAKVLDFIRRQGTWGATADEVQGALRLSHQNGSARVSTLAKKGLIVRTGRKRVTRSGRKAFVYVAAVEF